MTNETVNEKNRTFLKIRKRFQEMQVSSETKLSAIPSLFEDERRQLFEQILELFDMPLQHLAYSMERLAWKAIQSDPWEKLNFEIHGGLTSEKLMDQWRYQLEDLIISGKHRNYAKFYDQYHSIIYDGLVKGLWYSNFTRYDQEIIAESFNKLTEREKFVIEKYYGLYDSKETYLVIAKLLGVQSSRIGQIRDKALRKLCHPTRDKMQALKLASLVERYDDLHGRILGHESKIFPPEKSATLPEFKDRLIDQLELSVRTYNALKNGKILGILDLLKKTERDLLCLNNFGKRSLIEIKDLLSSHGLSFRKLDS